MTALFTKLNLGSRTALTVLNAPESFASVLATLDGVTVRTSLRGQAPIEFALAFVTMQAQVEDFAARLSARMPGDALLWFAYPKQSSKRYRCEFNRDTGWAAVGAAGFEPVRQVAIDEDWSALRFRRVEYIKKLTRSEAMVLSSAGKARTRGKLRVRAVDSPTATPESPTCASPSIRTRASCGRSDGSTR